MRKYIKKVNFITLALLFLSCLLLYSVATNTNASTEFKKPIFVLIGILLGLYIVTNIILVSFVYFWKRRRRVKGEESDAEIKRQISIIRYKVSFSDYYKEVWKNRKRKKGSSVIILNKYIERMFSKNEIKELMVITFFMSLFIQAGVLLSANNVSIFPIILYILFIISPYIFDLLILRTRYEESLFVEVDMIDGNNCFWCNKRPSYWDYILSSNNPIICGHCNSKFVSSNSFLKNKILVLTLIMILILLITLISLLGIFIFLPTSLFAISWIMFYLVSYLGYITNSFTKV